MTTERDILDTLETYAEAYCEKDIGRLMELFDVGNDISIIGTGADDMCRPGIAADWPKTMKPQSKAQLHGHSSSISEC